MKRWIVAAAIAVFAAFAWFTLPTPPRPESEPPSGAHAAHAGDPAERSEGVVLALNRAAKSVVISHGSLKGLGMPPMTMEFRIGDSELPERFKAGDRVRFHADAVGGAFTATRIEIAN